MLLGKGQLTEDACVGYEQEYIGSWIDEAKEINPGEKKYKTFAANEKAKSTLDSNYKTPFCRTALSFTKDFEDLSDAAKDVAIRLLNFIREQHDLAAILTK
jgi:hypothetical protein